MELTMATRENFDQVEVEVYVDAENEMYMTIDQLWRCLGYASRKGIDMLISRNDYLRNEEFSVTHRLWSTDNKQYETRVFTEDGIYEVAFLASTPKAEEFRAWVRKILKKLRAGQYMMIQNPDDHIREYLREIEERQARQYKELNNNFLALFKLLEGKFPGLHAEELKPIEVDVRVEEVPVDEQNKWKDQIYELAREAYMRNPTAYEGVNEVLSQLYIKLRNVYGFVVQEAKGRYRENHPGIGRIKTIDVVVADEQLRSIAVNLLSDAVDGCAEVKVSPLDEIIRPLIEKYKDKSPHGTATYRVVYNRMDVNWKNRETRYRKKLGISDDKPVRKTAIINNSESLLREFKDTVERLIKDSQM